jgi:putative peptide zinc metalloprotease protein
VAGAVIQSEQAAGNGQRSAQPRGLWAQLVREPVPAQQGAGGIWVTLAQAVLAGAGGTNAAAGIYTGLAQQADPAQYRPQAVPNLPEEQVSEAGQNLTVLRSPQGSYLRLTPAEQELWHRMDGSRTVAQLATLGFLRFKLLLPVAELVQSLRSQGFLVDPPVAVYRSIAAQLEARTAEGWGRRLLRTLRGRTFALNNLDGFFTALYRGGGWLLFTRLFQVLLATVSAAGAGAFLLSLGQGSRQVFDTEGITGSLLALWAALLVSFVLHECAHALAVKHYGRKVQRGGVMLYYGMPAAFVDTSDIWLAGRRARIVVSAAGPLSDLLVGGSAALLAYYYPGWILSGAAYRLAIACYLATLFNLNPLLELDGYFILVDALRLPDLRRRALAFVSGPLWTRLRQGAHFSKEERFFSFYGALTALYTAVASMLALWFWRRKLGALLADLWRASAGGRVVAVLLVVVVIVPVAAGLLLAAWGGVRAAAAFVQRRGYGRQPGLVAVVLLALVVVLAAAGTEASPYMAALLWAVGLAALVAVLPDYRGADVAWALYACAGAAGAALLGALMMLGTAFGVPQELAEGMAALALLLMMLAAFAALLDVDLREAPTRELAGTATLLALAFVAGALAFYRAQQVAPGAGFGAYLLAAMPAYFGALTLALLLPHLLGLRDSRLVWSWGLLWAGVFVYTTVYMYGGVDAAGTQTPPARALHVLAAGLWAAAWCVHLLTLRQVAVDEQPWPYQASISEAQRLQRAFSLCYTGCYRLLRAVYGSRRAQALDDRMDVLAATANWDVTLDHDEARISPALAAAPLDAQGARYAEVLRYTVAQIEEIAGASFAQRAIQSAYDALPWPEREAAGRRCFPDTPWAAALSSAFGSARDTRLRLLRQVDLFATCNDDELVALAAALHPTRAAAGQQIIAAAESPPGVWIIEAGEVALWQGARKLQELHRGHAFGAVTNDELRVAGSGLQVSGSQLRSQGTGERKLATRNPQPAARTSYRATVSTELLFLPAEELRALIVQGASHAAEGLQVTEVMRLLERVPLFADLPRHTLRGLAQAAQQQQQPARSLIVRQGIPSGTFYLIRSGLVAVIARSRRGETPAPPQVVAQLGPEEFFGELELLRGTPPVASVASITPVELLALPHAAIAALITGSGSVARSLEQVGTGRLLVLRSRTVS